MTGPETPNTLACTPVDTTDLPALPGIELPSRSFAQGDTQTDCQLCRRRVWLGRMQGVHLQSHPGSRIICYVCVVALMAAEKHRTGTLPTLKIRSLDPDR